MRRRPRPSSGPSRTPTCALRPCARRTPKRLWRRPAPRTRGGGSAPVPSCAGGFSVLLLVRNAAVVALVAYLAVAGRLPDASNFLIALTAGTMGETAVIVRIIVKWVFSDIDYAPRL